MESELIRYSDDFFSKASIYWHPLFPLLARTFENCHSATNGALNSLKPVAETFKNDVQTFVDYVQKYKPAHHPNKDVDSLVVSCISELRSHLLILEQVDHLVDAFCQNRVTNIKRNLSSENIFGREDPFSHFDSSSEDDDDWFDEIVDGQGRRAKRAKLDSDWIRKYSNIIPDYMSNNMKCHANLDIEGPVDLSKCTKPGDVGTTKDSVVEYRTATQIFQTPKAGGEGTCTAFRSVEYVVWENNSKKSSVPAKPVPVRSQGFAEYQKPTIGSQVIGSSHQQLTRNPINVHKPTTYCQHGPCPIEAAPVRDTTENFESRRYDNLDANHITTVDAKNYTEIAQTSESLETTDFSNITSFSDYGRSLPTRDSGYSIDDAKYSTTCSTLTAFGDSQSLMSASANRTNGIANLSTTSSGARTVNSVVAVRSDKGGRQANISANKRDSKGVPALDSVASRTRSSTAASGSIVSAPELESTKKSNSTAQTPTYLEIGDFSKATVFVDQSNTVQSHAKNAINVTYASHYQHETTIPEDGNPNIGSGEVITGGVMKDQTSRGMGQTHVVNGVDCTGGSVAETFDLESVTESALETMYADSDAESFKRDCAALISTLENGVRVKRPCPPLDDSRKKKNFHLLRPFSTPLVGGGCPSPKTNPRDPAEQKFVQDLVKSWETVAERRGKRNRKSPGWNDSVARRPPSRGVKFADETSAILKSWFDEHLSFPYPNTEDVDTLVSATGLTKVQVMAWFTYKRRMARKAGAVISPYKNSES